MHAAVVEGGEAHLVGVVFRAPVHPFASGVERHLAFEARLLALPVGIEVGGRGHVLADLLHVVPHRPGAAVGAAGDREAQEIRAIQLSAHKERILLRKIHLPRAQPLRAEIVQPPVHRAALGTGTVGLVVGHADHGLLADAIKRIGVVLPDLEASAEGHSGGNAQQ